MLHLTTQQPPPKQKAQKNKGGKNYILQIMEALFFPSTFLLASMIPQIQMMSLVVDVFIIKFHYCDI